MSENPLKMEVESDSDSLEEAPNIASKTSTLNLFPEKSREKYEMAYKTFMDWREENETKSLSENVLMTYFLEISHKLKPTTLWTIYSMLRTTLSIHNDVDIDKYTKLKAFLKTQAEGYCPKKSKSLSPNQIDKFIKDAPDREFLMTKVALIMGVMGACRMFELYQMTTTNIEYLGTAVIITIPSNKKPRRFTIAGNYYILLKKYADLRPPTVKDTHFFLNYQKGKCTVQRVGIHKFGSMGKQIANYLGLANEESYTGRCFRKSSAKIIAVKAELACN